MQFYSDDDVWLSLPVQGDVLLEIAAGWRPATSPQGGSKTSIPGTNIHILSSDNTTLSWTCNARHVAWSLIHFTPCIQPPKPDPRPIVRTCNPTLHQPADENFCTSPSNVVAHLICKALLIYGHERYDLRGAPTESLSTIPAGAKLCQREACISALLYAT